MFYQTTLPSSQTTVIASEAWQSLLAAESSIEDCRAPLAMTLHIDRKNK